MTDGHGTDLKLQEPLQRRRTVGRELAMKLLYVLDMRGADEAKRGEMRLLSREKEGKESEEFALELYRGVASSIEEVDGLISKTADNWDIYRMAYVDRALLRIGAYELMYRHDIPPKVAISEAIELAKKYSTDKSSGFVNGILDRIFQTLYSKGGIESLTAGAVEEASVPGESA